MFVGDWALSQLWLFWVMPIIGAALAGVVYKTIFEAEDASLPITGRPTLSRVATSAIVCEWGVTYASRCRFLRDEQHEVPQRW